MKAVVLLSGGLDSATVLAMAKDQGFEVHALSFDYGQRHNKELALAKETGKKAGVASHKIINLGLSEWGGSSLTDMSMEIKEGNVDSDEIPDTYVPARNMIFLSVAASLAEAIGSQDIFIGVSQLDYSGYVDCREDFIRAMEAAINKGTVCAVENDMPIKIHTPLINMSKSEEVLLGTKLGVDYSKTWSCYQGGEKPCGKCDSCILRQRAFAQAGLIDPAL